MTDIRLSLLPTGSGLTKDRLEPRIALMAPHSRGVETRGPRAMPNRVRRNVVNIRALARSAGTLVDIGGMTDVRPEISDTYSSLFKDAMAIGEDYRRASDRADRIVRKSVRDSVEQVRRRAG